MDCAKRTPCHHVQLGAACLVRCGIGTLDHVQRRAEVPVLITGVDSGHPERIDFLRMDFLKTRMPLAGVGDGALIRLTRLAKMMLPTRRTEHLALRRPCDPMTMSHPAPAAPQRGRNSGGKSASIQEST
jgi:hypothetical protein